MSKMSELELVIRDLRQAADLTNQAANALAEMFSTAAEPEAVTETKTEVTFDEVKAVFMKYAREGYSDVMKSIIRNRGVVKLSDIAQADYEGLLKEAEAAVYG